MIAINLQIQASKQNIAAVRPNLVYTTIKVSAPEFPGAQRGSTRSPISIAVALDASSSMRYSANLSQNPGQIRQYSHLVQSGEAVDSGSSRFLVAKYTLFKMIDALSDEDNFSLVTFANKAELRVPSLPLKGNRELIKGVIRTLEPWGDTNLGDGVILASTRGHGPQQVKRTMLFTDGEVNMGSYQTGPKIRAALPADAPQISSFGYGHGYNHTLLSQLSREGQVYDISSAERIPTAFANELAAVQGQVASDVELQVTLPKSDKVSLVELLTELPHTKTKDGFSISCGAIQSGQTITVGLTQSIAARSKALKKPITLVSASLSAKQDLFWGSTPSAEVNVTTLAQADTVDNPSVMQDIAALVLAKNEREARALADKGNFAGAQEFLRSTASVMRSYQAPELEAVAGSLAQSFTKASYETVGKRMSASVGQTLSRGVAGMAGAKVGNVDLDKKYATKDQKKMAGLFSITKVAEDDDMPDPTSMVTS